MRNMGTLGGNLCLDTRCTYYNQTYFWREALGFCLKKSGTVCHVVPQGKRCVAAHSSDVAPALISLGAERRDRRRRRPAHAVARRVLRGRRRAQQRAQAGRAGHPRAGARAPRAASQRLPEAAAARGDRLSRCCRWRSPPDSRRGGASTRAWWWARSAPSRARIGGVTDLVRGQRAGSAAGRGAGRGRGQAVPSAHQRGVRCGLPACDGARCSCGARCWRRGRGDGRASRPDALEEE